MSKLIIYTDGGARGNPGPAAIGIIITLINGISEDLLIYGEKIGNTTNNIAEYKAVRYALNWIEKNRSPLPHLENIHIYLDSTLVVNQLNGLFKIKNSNLFKIYYEIKILEKLIKTPIFYQYIPREKNIRADSQVNKSLDNL